MMLPLNVVLLIALAVALFSGSGAAFVTSHVMQTKIATIERDDAIKAKDDTQAVLDQFTKDAKVVHAAAVKAQTDVAGVNDQLSLIRKGLQNAKTTKAAPALPADCAPDAIRVRSLADSVNTVNRAVAGQ